MARRWMNDDYDSYLEPPTEPRYVVCANCGKTNTVVKKHRRGSNETKDIIRKTRAAKVRTIHYRDEQWDSLEDNIGEFLKEVHRVGLR